MKKAEKPAEKNGDYEDAGFCSFCLLSLEAKQPGGRDVRHKSTLTPYGQCPQAKNARRTKKK